MRQITEDSVKAFLAGRQFCRQNMDTDGEFLKLHGNVIAEKHEDGILIGLAGWNTPTTRERLNGLLFYLKCNLRIGTKKGEPYIYSWVSDWQNATSDASFLIGEVKMNIHDRYLIQKDLRGIEAIILWRA